LPAGSRRWPEPNSTSRIPRPPPRSSTPGCSSRPPRFARPHRQDPDAASRSPTPLPGVRRLAAAPGSWVCSSSPGGRWSVVVLATAEAAGRRRRLGRARTAGRGVFGQRRADTAGQGGSGAREVGCCREASGRGAVEASAARARRVVGTRGTLS
jgi:hypothetical protein